MAVTNIENADLNANLNQMPEMLDNFVALVKKEPETKDTTTLLVKIEAAKDAILWWFKSHGQQMAS